MLALQHKLGSKLPFKHFPEKTFSRGVRVGKRCPNMPVLPGWQATEKPMPPYPASLNTPRVVFPPKPIGIPKVYPYIPLPNRPVGPGVPTKHASGVVGGFFRHPWAHYWRYSRWTRFYLLSLLLLIPVWKKIEDAVYSPGNVQLWKEKRAARLWDRFAPLEE